MTISIETLAARIDARFAEQLTRIGSICDELTYEVSRADLIEVATALRDETDFGVDQLIDVCGMDYLTYGDVEWKTHSATESGFSRGVDRKPVILDESDTFDSRRFAIVYHLLSVANNVRLPGAGKRVQ